ncbi:Uncharacterized protein APZ42_020208 [Daphnia magna]|uniref:Uncharacterized protein n=1 Tax=Daphnia magna TaxID=35525 RepID=A0A164Y2Z9_9CRUS|nr:Uncharacterized protein APZ42_020208 [Daphnia magna]
MGKQAVGQDEISPLDKMKSHWPTSLTCTLLSSIGIVVVESFIIQCTDSVLHCSHCDNAVFR